MIIKCINNSLCSTITLNKEYQVKEEDQKSYTIFDDYKNELIVPKSKFTIVQEGGVVKSLKAAITELSYQSKSGCKNIKECIIKKDSNGNIKDIKIKFKY